MPPSSRAYRRSLNCSRRHSLMAGFKFRLAPVLRLREHVKDQRHWELRSLYEQRRSMLAEIDALERELAADDGVESEGRIFTVMELRLHAEHAQSVAKQIRAKRDALVAFDAKLAEKRAELVDAMRAVKSLEQLRVRHEERYWREQNSAEQRFADEIGQRKFTQPQARKRFPNQQ
jgi:flagellar export protein FliJ